MAKNHSNTAKAVQELENQSVVNFETQKEIVAELTKLNTRQLFEAHNGNMKAVGQLEIQKTKLQAKLAKLEVVN